MARAGFDWLIIDLEHGVGTESELLANLHAVGATRTAALVRPQSGERLRIGRALDLGAHGIMVPRIDTAEQAREAVSFLRYPPDGTRGVALSTRGAGMGELGHADVRSINPHILGIIQIESPSAVDEAAEHRGHRRRGRPVRRPGRPVAQPRRPGPVHRSGLPRRARTRSRRAAEDAGKAAGILLRDASALGRHRDLGYRFIGLGSDSAFIADGARAVLREARKA